MSIYNGFGTRQQESSYNKALYNTIFLLQLRIFKLFKGEKFDDIKFGKVLTKLYARLFTMEKVKYLPPKYSYAMKDLAEFLGIFEITEDQIKQRRSDGGISDTSSNLSYVTQSAFLPKKSQLDVIREQVTHHEEEDEEDGGGGTQEGEGHGKAIGMRAKKGSDNLKKDPKRALTSGQQVVKQQQHAFSQNNAHLLPPGFQQNHSLDLSSHQQPLSPDQHSSPADFPAPQIRPPPAQGGNRHQSQRASNSGGGSGGAQGLIMGIGQQAQTSSASATAGDIFVLNQQRQQNASAGYNSGRFGGRGIGSGPSPIPQGSTPSDIPAQVGLPQSLAKPSGPGAKGSTTINNNIIININNPNNPANIHPQSSQHIKRKPSFSSERSGGGGGERKYGTVAAQGKVRGEFGNNGNFPNIQHTNIIGSQQSQHRSITNNNRGGGSLTMKHHMYNYSDSKQRRFHQNVMQPNGQYFNGLTPHQQFSHQSHQRAGSYGGQGIGPLENIPPNSASMVVDPILEDYDESATQLRQQQQQIATLTPNRLLMDGGSQGEQEYDGGNNGSIMSPFRGGVPGVEDFPQNMSFERRAHNQFNNSMVASIYQQRPGMGSRRTKKSQSTSSAQQYSAYAQKFTRRQAPSEFPMGFQKFMPK
ncbi:hypothetical protein FGO68_gene15792 [Halteria grandinella]|uniref:Uncharacterized protein n=1 Tax=Halteria grandinella TaxID=5974 RepID=A0A8J8T4E5_HALGN|nr:hypothetical protein FGO68_gene15792 [Halteria grandinella]